MNPVLLPTMQGEHGKDTVDSDDDLELSDDEDDAPRLHTVKLSHRGALNRVRIMPQDPGTFATWSDTASVQVLSGPAWVHWLLE